ncbi:hypothetical protein Tco_1551340 [Tanacetum coccineum]
MDIFRETTTHSETYDKIGDVDVIARKLGMMMAVAVLSFFMFTLQEMVLNEYGKMLEEKSKVLVSEEWGTRCCGEQGFSEHTTALKQKERRMVQLGSCSGDAGDYFLI